MHKKNTIVCVFFLFFNCFFLYLFVSLILTFLFSYTNLFLFRFIFVTILMFAFFFSFSLLEFRTVDCKHIFIINSNFIYRIDILILIRSNQWKHKNYALYFDWSDLAKTNTIIALNANKPLHEWLLVVKYLFSRANYVIWIHKL